MNGLNQENAKSRRREESHEENKGVLMDIFEFRESGNSGVEEEVELLARRVIGAAIEVHSRLGPGLPENVYKLAMDYELTLRGIPHACEVPLPINYKGREVGEGRVDILVDGRLVLELKSIERLADIHRVQSLTYLKILNLQLALLLNFNVTEMRQGVKRVINTH